MTTDNLPSTTNSITSGHQDLPLTSNHSKLHNYIDDLKFLVLVMIVIAAVLLSGCTATNPHGNFTPLMAKFNADYQQQVAGYTASQLGSLYNPADTTFIITQDLNDVFGTELVTHLRKLGFAVQESSNRKVYRTKFKSPRERKEQMNSAYHQAQINPYRHHLKYAVVPINQGKNTLHEMYQVTLYLDNHQRISNLWWIDFDYLTNKTQLVHNGYVAVKN